MIARMCQIKNFIYKRNILKKIKQSLTFVMLTSAPRSISSFATSKFPKNAAQCKGVCHVSRVSMRVTCEYVCHVWVCVSRMSMYHVRVCVSRVSMCVTCEYVWACVYWMCLLCVSHARMFVEWMCLLCVSCMWACVEVMFGSMWNMCVW
mgnify:CR=1 FL=1